jgi:hypothetical protein
MGGATVAAGWEEGLSVSIRAAMVTLIVTMAVVMTIAARMVVTMIVVLKKTRAIPA